MKRFLAALATLLVSGSTAFAQTGGVLGKILNDKGEPLEGVAVTMEYQGGVTMTFELKTNKKGEFTQIGLRPGSWKFTYMKEGFGPFVSPYRISSGPATTLPEIKLTSAAGAPEAGGGEDVQKIFGEAVEKLQAGDIDGAVAAFDDIILKHPSLAEAQYNKAFALSKKKDYAGSEAALKRALELKPDYADARVLLSNIYSAQGMKDKALEVMTEGAAGGGDAKQLYNLGLVLLNSGKNDEATEAFLKAEAADPTHAEVQYYLATAALNAGKTDECVTRLEKYLALGPKDEQNKATATGLLGALKK